MRKEINGLIHVKSIFKICGNKMYIKYLSYTRIKNEFVDVRVAE